MTKKTTASLFLIVVVPAAALLGYLYGFEKGNRLKLRPAEIVRHLPPKVKTYKPKLIDPQASQHRGADPRSSSDKKETTKVVEVELPQPSIDSMDVAQISNELIYQMSQVGELSEQGLEKNIEFANSLISEEPENYSAYKSKMISLLLLEVKFQKVVELETYEDLMDEMLSFSGINPEDDIRAQIQEELGRENLSSDELVDLDHELLHIPFLRLSALKDYDNMAEISLEYIAEFPDSYLGYLYLAESYWKSGDEPEAMAILSEKMDLEVDENLIQKFLESSEEDSISRIERLNTY